MKKIFVENSDGVHLQSVFSDYTLCNDTMDGDANVDIELPQATDKRIVTCAKCVKIIIYCRHVRTKK